MLLLIARLAYIDGLYSVCEQAVMLPHWTLRLFAARRYGLQNGAASQARGGRGGRGDG